MKTANINGVACGDDDGRNFSNSNGGVGSVRCPPAALSVTSAHGPSRPDIAHNTVTNRVPGCL